MIVKTAEIRLYASFVHSLKEKRMIVRSLTERIKNRFNVSIAEVAELDIHQTILLGIACIGESRAYAESVIEKVINFIEENCEAEIVEILRETR